MGDGSGDGGSDFAEVDDTFADSEGPARRMQRRVEAVFRVGYPSMDEFVVAYSTDISKGGMFVATTQFVAQGSILRLEIALPDDGPTIQALARVAYVRADEPDLTKQGMGLEFLHVEGEPIEQQLSSFLTERLSEASPRLDSVPANVLVVDDDKSYREQIASIMLGAGHRVVTASDGLIGLGKALRNEPDLILADVQMPAMDGWQLLRMLRSRPSLAHVPVMFLTTLDGDQERIKGYQLGVDDYIAKPFSNEELRVRAAKVLSRARKRPGFTAGKNAIRGDIAQVALTSVLSFLELERRSGALLLVRPDSLVTLHVRDGAVVRVDLPELSGSLEGVDCLYYVLGWTEGRFEFTAADVDCVDEIGVPTSFALLEHARRCDESL